MPGFVGSVEVANAGELLVVAERLAGRSTEWIWPLSVVHRIFAGVDGIQDKEVGRSVDFGRTSISSHLWVSQIFNVLSWAEVHANR